MKLRGAPVSYADAYYEKAEYLIIANEVAPYSPQTSEYVCVMCPPVGINQNLSRPFMVNNPPVFAELFPGYPWFPLEQSGDTDSHLVDRGVYSYSAYIYTACAVS